MLDPLDLLEIGDNVIYRKFAHAFLFTLALSVGCGGGGGGGDFGDKFAELTGETEAQITAFCGCYAQFPTPYASKDECFNDNYQSPPPAYVECVENASKLDPDASDTTISCELQAAKGFTDCLEQSLDCNNFMNSFLACAQAFDGEIGQCPQLPANVQTALEAC